MRKTEFCLVVCNLVILLVLATVPLFAAQLDKPAANLQVEKLVPVELAERIALERAEALWGDITAGEPILCCDDNGRIVAYMVPFHFGSTPFPNYDTILKDVKVGRQMWEEAMNRTEGIDTEGIDEPQVGFDADLIPRDMTRVEVLPTTSGAPRIAHAEKREDFDLPESRLARDAAREKLYGIGKYGTIYVAARYDRFPIPLVSHYICPYYAMGDLALEEAQNALGTKEVELSRYYFRGCGHGQYFEFRSGNRSILVHAYSLKAESPEQILSRRNTEVVPLPEMQSDIEKEWQKCRDQLEMVERFLLADHIISNQQCIPDILWCRGCSPTSASMVIGYWDRWAPNVTYLGMGKLIDYWRDLSKYSDGTGPLRNVPNILEELRVAMGTDVGGTTDISNISPGITHVTNTINGYCFSSSRINGSSGNDWNWTTVTSEINNNRPFLWSVGITGQVGHSLCAWGYTDSKDVIVYNTWTHGRDDWYYKKYDNGQILDRANVHTVVPGCWDNDNQIDWQNPNGAESLVGGQPYTVWWYQWGTRITSVDLYYSTNRGASWTAFAAYLNSSPGWNSYTWTVVNTPTTTARIKIAAYPSHSSSAEYIGGDGSEDNFSITPKPTLHVSSPNGGEIWDVGSVHTITWTSTGTLPNVKLAYSINGGSSWITIVHSTLNDGSYSWMIPNNSSTQCRVKVADPDDENPKDMSDANFTIRTLPQSITVTSPNGGENWPIGNDRLITWTSENFTGNVQIQYSTNGGTTWITIVGNTPNDGSHWWLVPNTPSSSCRVKVSDTADGTPWDIGNQNFIIYSSPASILFDETHGYPFDWVVGNFTLWDGLSELGNLLVSAGYSVASLNTSFTYANITAADVLVIMLPQKDYNIKELEAMSQFLKDGKQIVVIGDHGGWSSADVARPILNTVLSHFGTGVQLLDDAVCDNTNNEGMNLWPHIPHFATHPVTQGLWRVVLFAGSSLQVIPPGAVVAWGDEDSYTTPTSTKAAKDGTSQGLASDVDGVLSRATVAHSNEPVMAVSSLKGGGCFFVMGDANIWCNGDPDGDGIISLNEYSNGWLALNVFGWSCSTPCLIDLHSPIGGEHWYVETKHTIEWGSYSTIGKVCIQYTTDSGKSWLDIACCTEDAGSYVWTVPNTPSHDCRLRICDCENTRCCAMSDDFAIMLPCEITVTSPNGGEEWCVRDKRTITWTSQSASGSICIEYSTDGGEQWQTIVEDTPDDGSHTWVVPNTPSEKCIVRIWDCQNRKCRDTSDEPFTIKICEGCNLVVSSPNGGEKVCVGERYEITWKSSETSGQVVIGYSTNGGKTWVEVTKECISDKGSFLWTVPDTPSQNCLVKICDCKIPDCCDESDRPFIIYECKECAITVLSPNAGEGWCIGEEYEIKWSSTGTSGSMCIEYSFDGGAKWIEVVTQIPDEGSYIWTVPDTPSGRCLIRIIDCENPNCRDESDQPFTIRICEGCNLVVTSPNGGEKVCVGERHEITWKSSETSGQVVIRYSTNGGKTWVEITEECISDKGSFLWTVPDTPSQNCLVKICDCKIPDCCDESDGHFEIEVCECVPPDLVYPTDFTGHGGDRVYTEIVINQNQNPIDAFSLEVTFDTNVLSLDTVVACDLTVDWIIVAGSEVAPGVVRIGGYSTTPIDPGCTGSIAHISFQVLSCQMGETVQLCTQSLEDDLAGWAWPCCGLFECGIPCSRGDVNCDDQITPGDALCAFWRSILGSFQEECLCECSEQAAEVNCDGNITPGDALCIFWRAITGDWPEDCQCPTTKIAASPSVSGITVESVKVIPGQIITVLLLVEDPQNLDAFSLLLDYSDNALEFMGVSPSGVTQNWTAIEGAEVDEGVIVLGGFHTDPISSDGKVSIAELIFKTKEGFQGDLSFDLLEATDDLAGVPLGHCTITVSPLPQEYVLHQNYPNPFNPKTEITFDLPEASRVTLTVYNILGQVVEVLVDSQMEPGSHTIHWNGEDASSGVCFYRLEAGEYTATKRMILMK